MVGTIELVTGALFQFLGCRRILLTANHKKCFKTYLYYTRGLADVSKFGKKTLRLDTFEFSPLISFSIRFVSIKYELACSLLYLNYLLLALELS